MPMKPHKDETQNEFMSRCVPEMTGTGPDKRPNDQAVAICLDIWRKREDKMNQHVKLGPDYEGEVPEPDDGETYDDFMSRCQDSLPEEVDSDQAFDACDTAWEDSGRDPPDDEEAAASGIRHKRRKKPLRADKQDDDEPSEEDAPPPDPDESYEEYVDRCIEELTDEFPGAPEPDLVTICTGVADDADLELQAYNPPKGYTGVINYKTHAGKINGTDFVLSDETPDRMGDIIEAAGWELTQFTRNPIALFGHRSDFPIGKWHNVRIDGQALKGHLELAPKGTSPRIDEIRALIDAGILKAVSVGFKPIDSVPLNPKDPWAGSRFKKQELVECSLVSVPANPNALAVAKSLNVSDDTLKVVFAGHGKRNRTIKRSVDHGGHATISRNRKGATMSLAQRITDLQTYIVSKRTELGEHLANQDDTNVSDADMAKTQELNEQIAGAVKRHAQLVEAEKNMITGSVKPNSGSQSRALSTTALTPHEELPGPIIIKSRKKEWDSIDLLVHAGTALIAAKNWGVSIDAARQKIYGDDDQTKVITDWVIRAPSAPAMTTVPGWAQELVHQIYADLMSLLFAKSIFPRLSAKGLTLSFGQAGKIVMPTRSRTPSLAGSFVGEGMAIPVRQGAFTSQTFTPKKLAVISVFTREMSEHSIPAIEGVIREAIQQDTAVAIDTILIDANPATTIRPAGILNGVSVTTATAGGGIPAIVGDLKSLVGALTANLYGNIRSPTWLMNPSDMLSASLATAVNTGLFPFMEQINQGQLGGIPIIDSASVPAKTVVLIDAADFVTMNGDAVRMELSDTATLHMEDTTPLDLVAGSPGTVASPQRSLFQTDSIALRMIAPLNWAIRRPGTVAWTQNVTW